MATAIATTATDLTPPEPRRRLGFMDLPPELRTHIYDMVVRDLLHRSRVFRQSQVKLMRLHCPLLYVSARVRDEVIHHFTLQYLGLPPMPSL